MKCPKCGFTSFPYLESCGKCGHGLAEQRAVLGVYALRPDPLDLRLAYQETPQAAEAPEVTPPQLSAGLDLGAPEEIRLDLAEMEDPALELGHEGPETQAAFPSSALDPIAADAVGPLPSHEDVAAPVFDLSEMEEIRLELEEATDLQGASHDTPQAPMTPHGTPVYNLDLDQDTDELTLGPEVDESTSVEAGEEALEYSVELDDEIEVEFEIDELDDVQGGDDSAAKEDDDER